MTTQTDDRPGHGVIDPLDDARQLPGRPRRQLLSRRTAAVGAVLMCAIGFLLGVRVEKGHATGGGATASATASATGSASRSVTGGPPSGVGGAPSGTSARSSTARSGTSSSSTSRSTGAPSSFTPPGSGASGLAALSSSSGAASGTITGIDGDTLYLSTTSGNSIAVHLTSVTKLTKTLGVTRNAIRPGDTVTVAGVSGRNNAITAASVTDSGAGSSTSSAGTTSSGG